MQVLVTLICAWLENQVCVKWLDESLSFGLSTPTYSPFVQTLSKRFPWLVFHICLPFVPLTWKNPELQARSFLKELLHSPNVAVDMMQRLPAGVKALMEEITLDGKKERNYEQREEPAEAASVPHGRAETSTQILFSVLKALQCFLSQTQWIQMYLPVLPQEPPSERCSPLYPPLE